MNLIGKVARAIWKYQEVDKQFDFDKPATSMADLIKAMSIDEAKCCIDAMPSIKWQKIETLPEDYKDGRLMLIWALARSYHVNYNYIFEKFMNTEIKLDIKEITHWAEINAPEEE